MAKLIIGIHGLGNKPPRLVLEYWWKKALREGLRDIGCEHLTISFKMVYWADILHGHSLKPWIRNKEHPLYLDEPYRPRGKNIARRPGKIRSAIYKYLEKQLDKIFLNDDMTVNFAGVTDKIIHRYFRDLETYYSNESIIVTSSGLLARDAIRERLAAVLSKYRRKDIMLIAHSMGSIVAYDVLTKALPRIKIHTLVTIGSPLGLPVIVSRIFSEQIKTKGKVNKLKTPENVLHHWYNLSDLEDRVALDHTLADDYGANSKQVRAVDIEVYNDYEINSERNPHKSYGYLRTPEMARIISTFLKEEKVHWLVRNSRALKRWMSCGMRVLRDKLKKNRG